eukprot:gnl/TRDRNA2_/TRDRNA2_149927_c0_seq2.p1 gnl/TRDRNA2_/TRDRNA2_149927_c0~~gnl/TRDRNA2_/TRDRNA2_149927_c0_seq2.p1  ORF type:complete len:117 (+),score=23.46 gnl/TRDRNA2_/TRDRNA2_149927_c0_seq2:210-560(+)
MKLSQPDAELFVALAGAARRLMDDFSARNLANAAWAFATAGRLGTSLPRGSMWASSKSTVDYHGQDLACKRLALEPDLQLHVALRTAALRIVGDFNAQELRLALWALSRKEHIEAI